MSKRKSYDVSFKLESVQCAEKTSKEAAARQMGVNTKQIREWCKQKKALSDMKSPQLSKKRLSGAGRKALDFDLEKELYLWILNMYSRNLSVSRKMIQRQAKARSTTSDFRASSGWLRRFMKRNGLSLSEKTTESPTTPEDVIPKLISYISHLRELQIRHTYTEDNIIAMDETACCMDMPSSTTVAGHGAQLIPLKPTGHEKQHFTVVLTASASGKKMNPFVVFKGKGTRLLKELEQIPGIVVRFSPNGWMNDTVTIDYLQSVIGELSPHLRLLVWDAYRCHTSIRVREETKRLHLHTAVVPGGCTKFIQAADVVWKACFKSKLRSLYDDWLANPLGHQYTTGGNLKAPSRALLCEWVKSSWEEVPTQMVKDSFPSCAITTCTDGSDNSKIHCFEAGQSCAAGKAILEEEEKKLQDTRRTSLIQDPFASDDDEEEASSNEATLKHAL